MAVIALPALGLLAAAAAAIVYTANLMTPAGRKANEQAGKALANGVKSIADSVSQVFSTSKPCAVGECPYANQANQANTEAAPAAPAVPDVPAAPAAPATPAIPNQGVFGPGTLTEQELKELQDIADKHNTPIDVVGSRARGDGRNIDRPELTVGKGEGTRSDIDVRSDGQADIDSRGAISDAISNVSGGAGNRIGDTDQSSGPVIQIRPNQPPKLVQ
jgi:hypothetical protein